jgi:transcription termination/antitermination protein NusA
MIDLKKIPKTEFAAAVAQIAGERNIDTEVVISSVKEAILAAFRRDMREHGEELLEEGDYKVKLDPESGETKVIYVDEEGDEENVTPPGFGRIAAQTAKQVILQKIREAEKDALISQFDDQIGTIVRGVILRHEGPNIIVGIGKAEAEMPKKEQVRDEDYYSSRHMSFYVKGIVEEDAQKKIIVSRSAPELVVELFKREVPEVNSGAVEIKRVARRPGQRTKIAVDSNQPGVDPVGSCVGQKGVRVQAVIKELNDEKIDVIPYSGKPEHFVAAALSPADEVIVEKIDDENEKALVKVAEDELAMAIGDGGENVSLAGELTGYQIKVEPKEEVSKNDNE